MRILTLLLLLTCAHTHGQAGWLMTLRRFNALENPANAIPERILLHGHRMKTSILDFHTIYNLRENTVAYLNDANGTYWVGSSERFRQEMRAEMEVLVERKVLEAESEQQILLRAMYLDKLRAWFPASHPKGSTSRTFELRRQSKGPMIAGFATDVYAVYADGYLLQTVWVSADLPISADFDFAKLNQFLAHLTQDAFADSFERSAQYIELLGKGYPVRVMVAKPDGQTYISEIIDAQKVVVSEADFSIPSEFIPGTLAEVGVWDAFQ